MQFILWAFQWVKIHFIKEGNALWFSTALFSVTLSMTKAEIKCKHHNANRHISVKRLVKCMCYKNQAWFYYLRSKNHPSAFLTCANPRATRAQTEPNATENQQLPPASPCGPHRRPPWRRPAHPHHTTRVHPTNTSEAWGRRVGTKSGRMVFTS